MQLSFCFDEQQNTGKTSAMLSKEDLLRNHYYLREFYGFHCKHYVFKFKKKTDRLNKLKTSYEGASLKDRSFYSSIPPFPFSYYVHAVIFDYFMNWLPLFKVTKKGSIFSVTITCTLYCFVVDKKPKIGLT